MRSERESDTTWYHLYVESVPHGITYMWNLQYWTNKPIYKQTHRHREQTCGYQGGRWGGSRMDKEFRVSWCKLLHLKWISNEVLLYSTGNYTQSTKIYHNGI